MEESVTSNPLLVSMKPLITTCVHQLCVFQELPPPVDERVQCSEVDHNGVTYNIGEFVYLPGR